VEVSYILVCSYTNIIRKRFCPYLVHDFRGFSVDKNVSETWKNNMKMVKNIGFDEVNVDNVKESLNSNKMGLSTEDLV
jgi:hypothetical protein